VLFVLAHTPAQVMVAGSDTSAQAMLDYVGARNAIAGFAGYKPLTPEAVIAARPDLLLFTDQGLQAAGGIEGALRLPGLAQTPAGRQRRGLAGGHVPAGLRATPAGRAAGAGRGDRTEPARMSTLVLRFLGVWPARRRVAPGLWLAAALGLGLLLAVQAGAVPVTRADWLSLFDAGAAPGGGAYVLWHLRLPRALFAVLVGAAMALAGGLTQGLFRNPLADPGLLGVNAAPPARRRCASCCSRASRRPCPRPGVRPCCRRPRSAARWPCVARWTASRAGSRRAPSPVCC
jgi:hypothetical protein